MLTVPDFALRTVVGRRRGALPVPGLTVFDSQLKPSSYTPLDAPSKVSQYFTIRQRSLPVDIMLEVLVLG